jgi:hypothetical protein
MPSSNRCSNSFEKHHVVNVEWDMVWHGWALLKAIATSPSSCVCNGQAFLKKAYSIEIELFVILLVELDSEESAELQHCSMRYLNRGPPCGYPVCVEYLPMCVNYSP